MTVSETSTLPNKSTLSPLRAREGESQLLQSPWLLCMYHAFSRYCWALAVCSLWKQDWKPAAAPLNGLCPGLCSGSCPGSILSLLSPPFLPVHTPASVQGAWTSVPCGLLFLCTYKLSFSIPLVPRWFQGLSCLSDELFTRPPLSLCLYNLSPTVPLPSLPQVQYYPSADPPQTVGPLQTRWGPERPMWWCVAIYSKHCRVTWNGSELSSVICQYRVFGANKVTNF